jgi:hypothetical protein
MLSAVGFDDQLRFEAHEVSDEAPDWVLATEFPAVDLPVAQMLP